MKKYTAIFCFIALFSCKKAREIPENTNNDKYTYTFNIATESENGLKTNEFKTYATGVDIASATLRLQYFVYKDNKIYSKLVQTRGELGYGQMSDKYAAGLYTMIIVGENGPSVLYSGEDLLSSLSFYGGGTEIFFKKVNFTVTNTNSTQNVTLNRIVGQLQVKFTDVIPSSIKTIKIDVKNERYFKADIESNTNELIYSSTTAVPDSVKGLSNYTITKYILNTSLPFVVTISAYDNTGKLFKSLDVPNVTTAINTRTLLSGTFFTAGGQTFDVTFKDSWDPTPIIKDF